MFSSGLLSPNRVGRLSVIGLSILVASLCSAFCAAEVPVAIEPTTAPTAPATTRPTTAQRLAAAVARYEEVDQRTPPPAQPVLFTGSSTFTRWRNVAERFEERTVLNRAFGGSQLTDLIRYADRVIFPYEPPTIVVYCGTNDIAAGASAEATFERFRQLADMIHARLPETDVYFLSIIPAPTRAHLSAKMDAANALIQAYIARHDYLHYIDARHLWSDSDGRPDEKLYERDRLHPSAEAYDRLVPVIEAALAGGQPASGD